MWRYNADIRRKVEGRNGAIFLPPIAIVAAPQLTAI